MGQILNVDLSENGMGSMPAKRVEFEENPNIAAVKGTISGVDCAQPTQFQMVVYNEGPALSGVSEDSPVGVMIASNACSRWAAKSSASMEDSVSSCTDLTVGQNVQIRPGMASTSGGMTTITTDLVRFWPRRSQGRWGACLRVSARSR